MLKKIVIIGPESTGKSSLCQRLAEHYQTEWCPEYAREYLLTHGKKYSYEDLLTIARGQVELEEKYESLVNSRKSLVNQKHSPLPTSHSLLFIDTNMYVMKVWCEFVFEKCHRYILDQIVKRNYDLYLLCNIDLPWVKDELREYPDLESRKKLYAIYLDIMINQKTPWVKISGDHEERFQQAISAVEKLVENKKT
jgi:NadR type nicotinamide-nucleotide adenylyltransferase